MRVISPMRGAAVAAAVLSGIFGAAVIDSGTPGIASAEAKDYYTKKRVNGQWISGRFPKKSFAKVKTTKKTATRTAAVQEPAKPEPAPAPIPVLAPTPMQEPPPPQAPVAQPAPLAPLGDDARMKKLQEALKARAQNLLVSNVGEPRPATPPPPHPISTASISVAKPPPPPPAPADPRSVTLDFGSGVKTTIFADGTIATEPFDIAAMKEIAARRDKPPGR